MGDTLISLSYLPRIMSVEPTDVQEKRREEV